MVVSYCTPGSPQCQAQSAMRSMHVASLRKSDPRSSCHVTQRVFHISVLLKGLHEVVGDPHRQVGVLEHHDRTVGFSVEVGVVLATLAIRRLSLLLFSPFALDELHHIGVPDLDRLHLGGPARLAARLHDRRDLVVNPHERQRTRRLATSRQLFALSTAASRGRCPSPSQT